MLFVGILHCSQIEPSHNCSKKQNVQQGTLFFEMKSLAIIPQLIQWAPIMENNTILINNLSFKYTLHTEAKGACTVYVPWELSHHDDLYHTYEDSSFKTHSNPPPPPKLYFLSSCPPTQLLTVKVLPKIYFLVVVAAVAVVMKKKLLLNQNQLDGTI
jgi:hypothetical protein